MAITIPSGNGNLILGNNLPETITGTASNDTVYGYAGGDTVNSANGNDYVDGGLGNDSLRGGLGNDTLLGGAGNDTLYGSDTSLFDFDNTGERDILIGGAGFDRFQLGDTFDGAGAINYFDNNPAAIDGFATIKDFTPFTDIIQLFNPILIFSGAVVGSNYVVYRELGGVANAFDLGVDDRIVILENPALPIGVINVPIGVINVGVAINAPFVGLVTF